MMNWSVPYVDEWIYRGDIRADFAGTSRIVVSVTPLTTGKRYAEVVFDTVVSPGSAVPKLQFGITPTGESITEMPGISGAALNFNGKVYILDVDTSSAGPTFGNGEVGMAACEQSTGKIWLGKVGTGWFGGGDPAAGTSPIATLGAGTYYVGWGESRSTFGTTPTGCKASLRTQTSQFTGTIPSGFTAWYS
jgi:hypothetical protein